MKICADCIHYDPNFSIAVCMVNSETDVDMVTGEKTFPTCKATRVDGPCGLSGELYKPGPFAD